jgi:hypothetical protein
VITIQVPGRVAMTQLFLGITGDSSGIGPRGPRAGYYLAMAQYWPKTAKEPQALELPEDAIALGP